MSPQSVSACSLLLLLSAAPAAAGPIPWSYQAPANEVLVVPGATGGFSFPNTPATPASGDTEIVVTPVYAWSLASDAAPDRVTSLPYRFAVEIEDGLSGEVATLSFGAVLSGSFWRTGSELQTRFTGPTAQTVELGGHVYTMALEGFDPPDGYGEEFGGSITAWVTVRDPAPPSVPTATPEPTAAALALLGLPLAALARRVRRCAAPQPDRRA
jgi:hypothetical protein